MKFIKKVVFLVLTAMVLLVPSSVIANDPSPTVEEELVNVGRVTLEDEKFPMENYKIETQVGDGIMATGDRALAGINDGLWSISKQIANFTIYAVEQLMTFDLISQIAGEISTISERIYESMSGVFLGLFVTIAGGVAAYRYFVNQQTASAIKAFLGVILILTATTWFFSDTKGNITWINEVSADIEGVASSTNVLLTSEGFDSEEPADQQEGTALLRNQLFDLMVKKPYLLLNYGSTKESDILQENPNRIDELLSVKPYSEEAKEKRAEIVTNEVEDLDNINMSSDFSGERFGIILVTMIATIAVSIPVIAMAGMKFLLQLFFIVMLIFTAIPLIMSLIPTFSGSAANHGKKIVSLIFYKAGLVLIIAVTVGIATLIYESMEVVDGLEGYLLMVFVMVLTMWGIFKYRSEIFEVISAGAIQGNNAAERITQSASHTFKDSTNKGMDLTKRVTQESFKMGGKARDMFNRNGSDQQEGSSASRFSVIEGGNESNRSPIRQETLDKVVSFGSSQSQEQTGLKESSNERENQSSVVSISDYQKNASEANNDQNRMVEGTTNTGERMNQSEFRNPDIHSSQAILNNSQVASEQRSQTSNIPDRQSISSLQENQDTSAYRQTESQQNEYFTSLANSIPPESDNSYFHMESSGTSNENVSAYRQPEQQRQATNENVSAYRQPEQQRQATSQETGHRSQERHSEDRRLNQRETAVTSEARGTEKRQKSRRIRSE